MTPDHPLDHAAAALTDALLRADAEPETLPASLAARLIADGKEAVTRHASSRADTSAAEAPSVAAAPATSTAPAATPPLTVPPRMTRAWRLTAAAGWLAAAASLAVWAGDTRGPEAARRDPPAADRSGGVGVGATPVASMAGDVQTISLRALRDSLLADPASIRRDWAPSADPAARAATGDFVWNAAQQRGVMRFVGLVPNDPRVAQYQLWIVDAERDARYPVDGGVFDVGADGEVLVLITPRLPVTRASLFAITLERPGGVVVSTRERLVLAAPVEG